MSETIRSINGSHSLQDIEQAIQGAESTGFELLRYSISFYDGVITNLITFDHLPIGQLTQTPLLLVMQGDPVPPGTDIVYDGVMLVSDHITAVSAYR